MIIENEYTRAERKCKQELDKPHEEVIDEYEIMNELINEWKIDEVIKEIT